MLCRHCNQKKANRPRDLCWACYYTPGIRDLYPPTSKFARRSDRGNTNSDSPLPAEPTAAPPGSKDKMRVMVARVIRGESLFHPADQKTPVAGLLDPFLGSDWTIDQPTGLEADGVEQQGA